MATSRYEVEYESGLTRVKLLSKEDADTLTETVKGVKSIKKVADNKQRSGARNKSASADGEDE